MDRQGKRMASGCVVVAGLFLGGSATPTRAEEPATRIPEVVVTATRTPHGVNDVPASAEIIGRGRIETLDPIAVEQLFKTMPGVDLQGSDVPGSAIRLNMRGLTTGYQSERILVLIDGRRINEQYQGNVEFATIPADGIERVEVLRGPASALYGSNAMGGVINIVTKRGRPAPGAPAEGGALRVAGGSYDTVQTCASYGGAEGRLDYFAAGSYVDTAGYTHNADGTRRDWTAWNGTGNLGWQIDEESNVRVFLGGYAGQGTDENSERTADKDFQHVLYTWNWGERKDESLLVRFYRNGEYDVYDWKFPGEGIYRQYTYASEVQQSLWLGRRNLVTAGCELRRDNVDIDEVAGPIDQAETVVAFYGQDEILAADTVRVTVGARSDHNNTFGEELSPRIGVLWTPVETTDIYGSVNRAYRAPAMSDRFVHTEYNGHEFIGNPDLKPETLTAYEVGWRQRVGDRVRTELATFYSDFRDGFDFMLDADGVFRNRNVTRMRIYGLETGVTYQLTSLLSLFANYSRTEGEYQEFPPMPSVEGNELAYLARDKGSAGIVYGETTGLSHALIGRVVGPRFGDAQNSPEQRMAGYVALDWHSRLPLGKRTELTLDIDNVLDQRYQELPGEDQPGINFMVGLETRF